MEPSIVVKTDAGTYPIFVGLDDWDQMAQWVLSELKPTSVVIATDENVDKLLGSHVITAFQKLDFSPLVLRCPAGEKSKSIEIANQWWQQLASTAVDRKAVVIALGGGVVGDLAGFIAATHLRGLRMVQVPTTLLAQVDSSVGGKVAINLPQGKNLVGCFWQPEMVWIAPTVLNTLSEREFKAGIAEVVKYAVICDADFFVWLDENCSAILAKDPAAITYVITKCCTIKAAIVEADTKETTGLRAILNFGHTIGHALENLAGYGTILHGEAVAIGMVAEAKLAEQHNVCRPTVAKPLVDLLTKFGLPTTMPEYSNGVLLDAMKNDKKNVGSNIVFVLPTRIGHAEICKTFNLLKS